LVGLGEVAPVVDDGEILELEGKTAFVKVVAA